MAILELKNLTKSYPGTDVLKDINLEIEEGEFVAILGFSGSGKTTLISLIAGLIEADEGDILLKGEHVKGAGPDRGIDFQSYSLMQWLTVIGNIRLAVDTVLKKASKAE
ncbi:MAG: ATP-binding cassette domain-containing protein, partial [Sphingomonadales bacterium]